MRFCAPMIASTGHAAMQSVQPMHAASSISAMVSGPGDLGPRSCMALILARVVVDSRHSGADDASPSSSSVARLLRLVGWRAVLIPSLPMRRVVLVYPHTSNWDFPIGLAFKWMTSINFRFIAKNSLFRGPFDPLFRHWGGIPVNRDQPGGLLGRLAGVFAAEHDFRLVITPEGTRAFTNHWKSGFCRLARTANVPVALAFIDYGRREVGVGASFQLSGDAVADLARIAAFYADKVGRHPERAGLIRFPDNLES